MTVQDKLRKALRGKFKVIYLEMGPRGTVFGVVTSPSFRGQDDGTRLERVWAVLRLALSTEDLQTVSMLVPLTPAEQRSIAADAA